MAKIAILSTGGTWSKLYNPLSGELYVPSSIEAVRPFLRSMEQNHEFTLEGVIYKDSLEMDDQDRHDIASWVIGNESDKIIILHGTDTMDQTAAYLNDVLTDEGCKKHIVLTGSMNPVMIDPVEFSLHLGLCVAKLQNEEESGIFIAMHGLLLPFDRIEKNKVEGFFRKSL
jgi:L-asparaginase